MITATIRPHAGPPTICTRCGLTARIIVAQPNLFSGEIRVCFRCRKDDCIRPMTPDEICRHWPCECGAPCAIAQDGRVLLHCREHAPRCPSRGHFLGSCSCKGMP